MRRRILIGALAVIVAASGCESGAEPSQPTDDVPMTSTTTSSTTTTVDPTLTCDEIGTQAADLLRRIAAELEQIDAAVLGDRSLWPEPLVELEAEGRDLDQRVAETGCDPGAIQATAVDALGELEVEGRLVEILVEVLTGAP